MKKKLLSKVKKIISQFLLGSLLAGCALATTPDTLNTVPSSGSSFLSDLQTFLKEEDAERYGEQFRSFVVSGGTHGTGASLVGTPSSLIAYPGGWRVTETGSITYTDNALCFVIVHKDTTGNVSSFVRVSGTHYAVDCTTGSQPALPLNSSYLMEVTTSGGSITAVTDLRFTSPLGAFSTITTSSVGPHVIGSETTNSLHQLLLTGTYTPGTSAASASLRLGSTLNAGANQNSSLLSVAGTLVEAGSGTHVLFAGINVTPPSITAGAASLTNSASLYISDAPSGATNNYALWVDSGVARFDGTIGESANRVSTLFATNVNLNGTVVSTATSGHSFGGSAASDALFNIRGSLTAGSTVGRALYVDSSITGFAGANIYGVEIAPTLLEAGSGTHALLAGSRFSVPTITAGAATVNFASTVYIEGPTAATVAAGGANYALWVDAGTTRLDGNLFVGNTLSIDEDTNDLVLARETAIRWLNLAQTSYDSVKIEKDGASDQLHLQSTADIIFKTTGGTQYLSLSSINSGPAITFLSEASADPTAPAANRAIMYAKDNGAGKTQLCAIFSSGATQCFATQP